MKAFKILVFVLFSLMWVLMAFFTLAGLQTIEWCQNKGTEVPFTVWVLLGTVVVWNVFWLNLPSRARDSFDRFIDWMTDEG